MVKSSDREVKEILAMREHEEKDIQLVISVYDSIRNNTVDPAFTIVYGCYLMV